MQHKNWLALLLAGVMLLAVGCAPSEKPGTLEFTPPEGFVLSETNEQQWVSSTEGDNSNILWSVSDKGDDFAALTRESLEESYEKALKKSTGEEIDVTIDSYKETTVAGAPALELYMSCHLNDQDVKQLQYMIDGDGAYVLTYTQIGDADWMSAYEASAKTIRILPPEEK